MTPTGSSPVAVTLAGLGNNVFEIPEEAQSRLITRVILQLRFINGKQPGNYVQGLIIRQFPDITPQINCRSHLANRSLRFYLVNTRNRAG
jgi:hypothetical protein